MATTAEAIERMAVATGIPRVTVERAAFILRKADDDLWPTGGRGGGIKAARPKVSHLVNLCLTIVALDPLTEAPELVRRYRELVPAPPNRLLMLAKFGPDRERWTQSEEFVSKFLDRLCPGSTLGDMLDELVRHLMSADDRVFAREHLRSFTVHRFRFAGGAIGASLETSGGDRSFREPVGGLLPLMEDGLEDPRVPAAAVSDIASVGYKLFEIMADLALDTECELGQSASSDTASRTAAKDVETTTPATVGTGPAPVDKASQPGANPVNSADTSNQQDSDENKRGQCPLPFSPHGSPSSDHSNQRRDDPPWPSLDSPLRSAD
jgi:hypothetical protein